MGNTTVALFKVPASLSHAAFEALSAHWAGILVSDGYAVYQPWVHGRPPCLAHLIRQARSLAERQEPELAQFGSLALTALPGLIHWAHAPPQQGRCRPGMHGWYIC
jgi:transposase